MTDIITTPLFRPEAVATRATRLHGEIMLSSSIPSWVVTSCMATAVVATITWATLASYARTELVPGVVASIDPIAKVVASRPGLVTQVLVTEGAIVHAGDTLAVVHVEQSSETGDATASLSLKAIEAQRGLAQERLALEPGRVAAERARLNAAIRGAHAQLGELTEQLLLQDSIVQSARNSYEQILAVVERGFVTRVELDRRKQTWLQAEQGRRSLMQQQEAARASAAGNEAELARLPIDSAQASSQLQGSIEQLVQVRAQQTAEQGYAVKAPISGRVTSLQSAAGRFADGRVPLMTIIPEAARMRVDLYAPSRSIGFVRVGQPVRLLYDAFPYQRFGSFGGRITSVGRSVIAPSEVDAVLELKDPVYRVSVDLDAQKIGAFGLNMSLEPGMTLSANIILERRSFIEWLFDPLRAVANRT